LGPSAGLAKRKISDPVKNRIRGPLPSASQADLSRLTVSKFNLREIGCEHVDWTEVAQCLAARNLGILFQSVSPPPHPPNMTYILISSTPAKSGDCVFVDGEVFSF
jgi:hypothetical protein